LLGNHHVVERLGEGGMGVVYVGSHETLGRRVVVKVLERELSTLAARLERRRLDSAERCRIGRHALTHLVLRLLLAVICPAVLLHVTSAAAQPAPSSNAKIKAAKSYTDAGLAAQNAGDHDTAITFYSKAYDLVPHPILLFNIAQAHRLAGRDDEAADFYQRFLATKPTGPEARIARDLLAEITKRSAKAAREAEESREAEEARKTEEAREATRVSEMREPSTGREPPSPLPRDAAEPSRPGRSPWYRDVLGDVLVLGGTASLALGGFAYSAAREDVYTANNAQTSYRYMELLDGAHTKRLVGIVFASSGVILVGTGVLRFVMVNRRSEAHRIAVTPTLGGGLLTWTRSF